CIAVKSVELQSAAAGIKYLRMLREAAMLQGKNIAKQAVLIDVAKRLAEEYPGIVDTNRFVTDLTTDNGLEAFRVDWQETQNRNISRTPTLIMRAQNKPAIMVTGYRPYEVLLEAVKQVAPGAGSGGRSISRDAYIRFRHNL